MLSVIIPVFNGEKYLDRCLSSILEGSLRQVRIIVVDDGSTDCTRDIVKRFCELDNRVTYLYQQNSGVSAARNKGLKYVNTEYVTFVDADDWIDRDIYQVVCSIMTEHHIDIMQFSHRVTCRYQLANQVFDGEYRIYTERLFSRLFSKDDYLTPSVCDKVYRTEVIQDLAFPIQYRYGEDLTFLYSATQKAQKIACTDYVGYYYFMNSDSATQKVILDKRAKLHDSMTTVELALHLYDDLKACEKERIYLRLFEGIVAWNKSLAVDFFHRNPYRKEMRIWLDSFTNKYKKEFSSMCSIPVIYRYSLMLGTRFTFLRIVLFIQMVWNKLRKRIHCD